MSWVEKKEAALIDLFDKYAMRIGTSGVLEIMVQGRHIFNPEGLTRDWAIEIADKWSLIKPDKKGS